MFLLINEPPIQVPPLLAETIGFNKAAILQEIHYRLMRRSRKNFWEGRYWVPNVFYHLHQRFFFWSGEDIADILDQLEESGILLTLRPSGNRDLSKLPYYSINYDLLKERGYASLTLGVPVYKEEVKEEGIPPMDKPLQPSFTLHIHQTDVNLYKVVTEDPSHFLRDELILEVQERQRDLEASPLKEAICHFGKMDDSSLRTLISDNPTLYKIIMQTFYMKILDHVLSFCRDQDISTLVIFSDDPEWTIPEGNVLEIYLELVHPLIHLFPLKEEKDKIIISLNSKIMEMWCTLRDTTNLKFQQTLWREQKTNPLIRRYLLSHVLPKE